MVILAVFLVVGLFAMFARADEKLNPHDVLKQGPKKAFWDLGILRICVNGLDHCYYPGTDSGIKYISVPITAQIYIGCWAKYTPPPPAQITDANIAYWGSGKFSYKIELNSNASPYWDNQHVLGCKECALNKTITLTIPPFTRADVQGWPASGVSFNDVVGAFTIIMFTKEDVGKTFTPSCMASPVGGWLEGGPDLNNVYMYPKIHVGEVEGKMPVGTAGAASSTDKPVEMPANTKGALVQGKSNLVVKSFSTNPQKPVAGMPFDLTIVFWNSGNVTSEEQQFTLSWKVVSGGPGYPTTLATYSNVAWSRLPNMTDSHTIPGFKGNEGTYELTVSLVPMNTTWTYTFPIGPGLQKTMTPSQAPVQQQGSKQQIGGSNQQAPSKMGVTPNK